jgi:hypothetical protein
MRMRIYTGLHTAWTMVFCAKVLALLPSSLSSPLLHAAGLHTYHILGVPVFVVSYYTQVVQALLLRVRGDTFSTAFGTNNLYAARSLS